uniref:Origin recognition complex subunit 2 n=1 Tax=Ascaris lumbricoides TaxID=6252 RepID=A0A0M3I2Q5_ASCLU
MEPTRTRIRTLRSPIKNVKDDVTSAIPSKTKRKVKFGAVDENKSSPSKSPRKQKVRNDDDTANDFLHVGESNENLKDDDDGQFAKFNDELTKVPTYSIIENYFNLGKMKKSVNRSKKRKGRSPERGVEHDEEAINPDEEIECDLEKLRDWLQRLFSKVVDEYLPKEVKQRNDATKELFPIWLNYLSVGFNLLLYGVGSKKAIMQLFCEETLTDYTHLVVDAFHPAVSTRIILQCLETKLNIKNRIKCGNTIEWAANIASTIEKRNEDIILVINNIDGPGMRDSSQQCALMKLAKCSRIHIVASFDHFNAFLLWTQEILAGDSRLLRLNVKTSGHAHTHASLDVVWASLTFNSRMILYKMAKIFYATNEPLEFFNLYRQAREDFLVSSETSLRQQLVELDDHHLITKKRHQDGDEYIAMNVDHKVL